MSSLTVGSTITIHNDADGVMTCTLCGRYRNSFTRGFVYDVNSEVVDPNEDYDGDECQLAPVCSTCEDKFDWDVLQEL